jgi:hypothetical protein
LVEGFDYLAARSEAGDLLGERDLAVVRVKLSGSTGLLQSMMVRPAGDP